MKASYRPRPARWHAGQPKTPRTKCWVKIEHTCDPATELHQYVVRCSCGYVSDATQDTYEADVTSGRHLGFS